MPATTATTERRTGEPQRARIFLVEVEASCNHTGVEPNILGNKTISDTIFFNTFIFFFELDDVFSFTILATGYPARANTRTMHIFISVSLDSWVLQNMKRYILLTPRKLGSPQFSFASLCVFLTVRENLAILLSSLWPITSQWLLKSLKISESLWKFLKVSESLLMNLTVMHSKTVLSLV